MWSLITPTFCMNAYTLVGPTKRYPCDLSCFANASACGVEVGRSARDRGARVRVISYDVASAARVGDADSIARALSTVACGASRVMRTRTPTSLRSPAQRLPNGPAA